MGGVLLLSAAGLLRGQEAEVLELDVVLRQALEQNLGLQIERLEPLVAEEALEIAGSRFDPELSASALIDKRQSPSAASDLDGAQQPVSESQRVSAGVSKGFSSGGEIGLSTGMNRGETNSEFARFNPDYSSDVTLSARQPLLRGFGRKVNLAPIARAQLRLDSALWQVRQAALDVLREAEIGYWNLALARERLDIRLSSVELAERLLEESREQEAVGLGSRLDVLQAEAGLASRREAVILARQAIANASDQLYRILGTLTPEAEPLAVAAIPETERDLPGYGTVIQRVLESDIGIRIQENGLEQNELDLLVARNNALPNLDARLSGGYLGRAEEGPESYGNALDRDGYRWDAGLEFSIPWGLRAERARQRQARLDLRREELTFEIYRQNLLEVARRSYRALAAGIERLEVTAASERLNLASFEQARAEYNEGVASFRDVLEAQQDLDEARLRRLEAEIDTIRSRINLNHLDGTLLERHGYTWQTVDASTDENLPAN